MPNAPFHQYLGSLLGTAPVPPPDLDTDTIKARLVSDDDWALDPTALNMVGIPSYNGIPDQVLANPVIGGTDPATFGADDSTFPSVDKDGAKLVHTIVVWKDDGGNGQPLWYYDLATPVDPNGTDIDVRWNAGLLATLAGA